MPWLEPGEVLVHVGPRKTGSTTIQASLADSRTTLREHDFFLAPKNVNHVRAVRGLFRKRRRNRWEVASAEVNVRGETGRGIVSDELLIHLKAHQATRMIETLGGPDRVRILITNRPLIKALPSLWQQLIKTGWTSEQLPDWLAGLMSDPDNSIWEEQRLDQYFDFWSNVIAKDRIAVLPVGYDDGDLLSEFETLIGIPGGELTRTTRNISLTAQQVEMLRFRNSFLQKSGVTVKRKRLLTPQHSPRKNRTPIVAPDAVRPALEAMQQEVLAGVTERGAFVVGGVDRLGTPQEIPPETPLTAAEIQLARYGGRYIARLLGTIYATELEGSDESEESEE